MQDLDTLRQEIDHIDQQVLELLARRLSVARAIGAYKQAADLPIYDPAREEVVRKRLATQAAAAGLDPTFVQELWQLLLAEARATQADTEPH